MVKILSSAQLIQNFVDDYRTLQPNMDTKAGAVARDLFVEGPAVRLAELYLELQRAASSNSIAASVGQELENKASNFGESKNPPGSSVGIAQLTFNSLYSDIPIPAGALVYSRSGISFRITNSVTISASNASQYKAIATTYRQDFDFIGITDEYAIEVSVECTATGTQGNIPKFGLISTSIPGISGVTNIKPFEGGSSVETETTFKNRIVAIFSGSSAGTELGYRSAVKANTSVLDAIVICPGDPLMFRDDTVVQMDSNGDYVLDSDGDPIIVSEGTGGKVDINIYGRRLVENINSFIYTDKSGTNDPTNVANDYILGQIPGDANKTIMRRRRDNIKNRTLPNQPANNIIEVVGSRSGLFAPNVIDEYGISMGNYSLVKDNGYYAGSAFGSDKLHWTSNYIGYVEDISRNTFNGQDPVSFTDITEIGSIKRSVQVSNENSTVLTTDRSILQLRHTPVKNVGRVINFTTGERYTVVDRNPFGAAGSINTTGKIKISGKNLPGSSDVLRVDYEWEYTHDKFTDYDSFNRNDNPRQAIDVVDWGYSNAIRREGVYVDDSYSMTVEHNVSSVISVNKVSTFTGIVTENYSTTGLANLVIDGLSALVTGVVSVKRTSDDAELYNTNMLDGTWNGYMVILPSDTSAVVGEEVYVTFNPVDLFTVNSYTGNFKDKIIYLPEAAKTLISSGDSVEVNYIANISEILPSTNINQLPVTGSLNGFVSSTILTPFGVQPTTHEYSGSSIIKNLRQTPSNLGVVVSATTAQGTITIKGTTVALIQGIVTTCVNNGLSQNLDLAIKSYLGLDANSTLSSNIKICKLVSLEKVEVTRGVVTSVLSKLDTVGYVLSDNSYDIEYSTVDAGLGATYIRLPSTTTNDDALTIGDSIRVSFYIATTSDIENISFSTNGTLYTNKRYATIDMISASSGFKSGTTMAGTISLFSMSQPPTGARYRVTYKYLAPKANERITVRYNSNALIGDLTLAIEDKRSPTADVIIKGTSSVLVDVTATITVLKEYTQSAYIVAQNVGDKIVAHINALSLGSVLHPSDLTAIAYQVSGLDSITITRFNKADRTGNVGQIRTLRTQYVQANNIIVDV